MHLLQKTNERAKKIKDTGYSKCGKELDKACFQHNLAHTKTDLKKGTNADNILWKNALSNRISFADLEFFWQDNMIVIGTKSKIPKK